MQIVINIPEEIYKASQIIDVKYEDVVQIPLETIANGTPIPDNATNGDVIKAIFPNSEYEILYNTVFTEIDNGLWFTLDWWNAPYQKGGKE